MFSGKPDDDEVHLLERRLLAEEEQIKTLKRDMDDPWLTPERQEELEEVSRYIKLKVNSIKDRIKWLTDALEKNPWINDDDDEGGSGVLAA